MTAEVRVIPLEGIPEIDDGDDHGDELAVAHQNAVTAQLSLRNEGTVGEHLAGR